MAQALHVPLTNIPGLSTDAVADLTILLLLGASRLIVVRSIAASARRPTSDPKWKLESTGPDVAVGLATYQEDSWNLWDGPHRAAVAIRARGFGMKIHYHDPHRLSAEIEGGAIFHGDPYDLLRVSPFLSLNAPESQCGTPADSGLISRAACTSDSSFVKLKSVAAVPVINRAPRLNVRSWIAH